MSVGMCKNCANWSSTDQVWGECTKIEGDYPNGDIKCRASINVIRGREDVTEVEFWTREDFGCRAWSSLRAVLNRIEALSRNG